MNLDFESFRFHDAGNFPVIWVRAEAEPGAAQHWQAEMDALLAYGQPFVFVMESHPPESQAVRKTRALWFKRNKAALLSVCRGVIAVEEDALKRALLMPQAILMGKTFGIGMEIVSSKEDAVKVASRLLANSELA